MTERDPVTRVAKPFFVLVCGGLLVWLLAPAVFEDTGDTGPAFTSAVVFLALTAAPPVLYGVLIHRRFPVVVVGAALTALEIWCIWVAQTGESSTSGLALLWIPFGGIPLVLLGRLWQTWTRPDP